MQMMSQNWAESEDTAMDNPLGGIKRGWAEVRSVYEHIFSGLAEVYVEFFDYTLHDVGEMLFAVGRNVAIGARAAKNWRLSVARDQPRGRLVCRSCLGVRRGTPATRRWSNPVFASTRSRAYPDGARALPRPLNFRRMTEVIVVRRLNGWRVERRIHIEKCTRA